jgi:hypothetical protein
LILSLSSVGEKIAFHLGVQYKDRENKRQAMVRELLVESRTAEIKGATVLNQLQLFMSLLFSDFYF